MVYVLEQIIITGGLHVVDRLELARFKIIGLSVLERQITDGYLVVIIYRPLALIPHRLRRKGHYKAYARYVVGGPKRSDKLLVEVVLILGIIDGNVRSLVGKAAGVVIKVEHT